MQAVPSAVSTRMFIEPSVWPPAASQTMPGAISSGPDSSRSSSRIAPGLCSRSMWCFTYSAGYCPPMIPEAEYSSSRRFVTTVWRIENWLSWPAWSMWWCVCRIQRTSLILTPCFVSWRRSVISFVTIPVIPSVSMISGWLAPVSTRIGSVSGPRIR